MGEFLDETAGTTHLFDFTSMPLQDITMNQTLPLTNGTNARSPGKISPTGVIGARDGAGVGRTMKEYEDQLEALKKENFNLKLRIYFLEERMGITSADENAIKKNIELKVEIESLRKELVEKQELLSQAAKAFELIEEQKAASSRNQAQYQQSLETEREKIRKLEKELAEYQEKVTDASIYYKEAFGITPEQALENDEKLHQMEELVASLDAEVKQVTGSLEEERIWAQELEGERDEFRERLEAESRLRENLAAEKSRDAEELRERVKELEEQLLKRDTVVQQCRNELQEKERVIKEKNAQLEEKCRVYEEVNAVSEKRKKQVDQLRTSIKSRDDALTDLNNKHRALLSQFENNYSKRSPPSSPSAMNPIEDPLQSRMGQKVTSVQGMAKRGNTCLDWEPNRERSTRVKSPLQTFSGEVKDELEEKDNELKRQEEARKQLVLKLCNVQKYAESTEYKLKKLEGEHEKAIKTIQGFMERQQQLENTKLRKEQKIMELEFELNRLRDGENSKGTRDGHDHFDRSDFRADMTDDPERDPSNQQRFDEMEAKINDLRDQIETIKAEKSRLEQQIEVESELRTRIKKLEDENEAAKVNISALTKDLDHLTLSHSQILVENTKLTNDKLRLEQEGRKTESRCDMTIRSMHDKFNKEISDLNQINESHRARLQELEVANKELRRHVAVCDASDSAPSSSGVSSIPVDAILKQTCDDIMQEYQLYNNSQYWVPMNYPTLGGRSKSSCSPDLGIESDAAITTMRPLKDTLKITESMTNLLSDEDNGNNNRPNREVDSESPLPIEGLDEVEALKQENETLKRRLMKTRRALEDTFQHLSTSNKNKKNVEKAITKQLQITKSILKKTRTYEEPLDN